MEGRAILIVTSALACAIALAACNAIDGAGGLFTAPCAGDACADAAPPAGGGDDAAVLPGGDDDGAPADAGADADASDAATGDGGPTAYCAGLLLYLRLDGSTDGARGETAQAPDRNGTTTYGPGKYGQAIFLNGPGDAYYWAATSTTYANAQGTISMWLKSTWTFPSPVPRTFTKATTNLATGSAGPQAACDGNTFGIAAPGTGVASATLDVASATTYWQAAAFNHVVVTWNTSPTAGGATFSVTLDGDAANGAATYGQTTTAWTAGTAAYFRIGSSVDVPAVYADDVAVWDHPLTPAQIKAIYASPSPIGDVCP